MAATRGWKLEDLLDKTKKAVEKYGSKHSDRLKASKSVLACVASCRKFIDEIESEESGMAQKAARELSQILGSMPLFRQFNLDKKALSNIQNKTSAQDHLESIVKDLNAHIKNLEQERKRRVYEWVRSHSVFGGLRKVASKKQADGAYVLLFRKAKSRHGKANKSRKESLAAGLAQGDTLSEPQAESFVQDSSPARAQARNPELMQLAHGAHDSANCATLVESGELKLNLSPTSISVCSEKSDAYNLQEQIAESLPEAQCDLQGSDAVESELALEAVSAEEVEAEAAASEEAVSKAKDSAESQEGLQQDCVIESEASSGQLPAAESSAKRRPEIEKNNAGKRSDDLEEAIPELVIRPTPDGKVFTRFRLKEFADESRIYRMFRTGAPIIGACVIAGGKLEAAIGTLPEPSAGADQLKTILAISKDAVSKPGRAFVETHEVLSELFQMCKAREIDKDTYILLFEYSGSEKEEKSSAEHEGDTDNEQNLDTESERGDGEQVQTAGGSELEESAQDLLDNENTEDSNAETESQDHSSDQEALAAESAGLAEEAAVEESFSGEAEPLDLNFEDNAASEPEPEAEETAGDDEPETPQLSLVSKKTEDGRIITRYRSFDFNDSRTLFEEFRNRNQLAGAAVIRGRELLKEIGVLPPPAPGQKLIDLLLAYSRDAVGKPSMEFIEQSEVLKGLHELAVSEQKERELEVVIFLEQDGKPIIMHLPDRKGRLQPKSPLLDFRNPKNIFDRFKSVNVAGASVIGEAEPHGASQGTSRDTGREFNKGRPEKGQRDRQSRDNRDGRDSRDRQRSRPRRNPSVLKAFGRTPLRQNVVLSPEVLKRLGVDLSIL